MEVLGSVDRCDEFVVEGWITIQGEPDKKLCLDVCLDEKPIGQCIADRFREDLQFAGLANGHCAFRFEMPSFITAADLGKIRIRLNNSILSLDMKTPATESHAPVVPLRSDDNAGLWIDRIDWLDQLAFKHRMNKISEDVSHSIFQFVRDGFLIIENAISEDTADRLNDAIELIWRRPPDGSVAESVLEDGTLVQTLPRLDERGGQVKLLDLYAHSAVARDAIAAPKVAEFLSAIFENRPKAFRSESLWQSPNKASHRDSDVVKIAEPKNAFATVFTALEDIAEGGELECLVGSHRSVSSSADPEQEAKRHAQTKRRFLLKKGDALILHADLVYSDVEAPGSEHTRRSLLTYFLPHRGEPLYRQSTQFKEFTAAGSHFVSQFCDVPSI